MKVVIVGAGVVGLSTAWALTRLGHEAVVYDQGLIPNPRAASFDQHRMIRLLYPGNPGYARMVLEAFEAWERLWADLGARHFFDTGVLALGGMGGDLANGAREVLNEMGQAYEILDRQQIETLCPYFALPESAWGLMVRPSGPLFADRIVTGLAAHLESRGVVLNEERRVVALDPMAGEIELEGGGRDGGDAVVVCVGAWIGKLLPHYAGGLVAQRQAVCYLEPPQRYATAWRDGPACDLGAEDAPYILPPVDGTGLKFGLGPHLRPGDPDASREPEAGEPEGLFAQLAPFLKEPEDYRIKEARICYYTTASTPRSDDSFLAERQGRCIVISNCSGHMFKFGAVLGEQLALAATGALAFQAFARWAAGDREVTAA
ncbi:MAG: FAD-dependent oxidoreductase [Kiloniellales bacterium]|nr:FAD-dependent oxidoreductase [Kiloniellales bacterium]